MIFEKIIPNVDSKFLYELALLELVEASLKIKRWEKAEIYIFYVLKNIDSYAKSEMYNVMNSFKMLVKAVKYIERSDKIQIVEFLEDLQYIELAYNLAKEIQLSLPPESMKIEEIRKIVRRLHTTPIDSKPESSIEFEEDKGND